MKEKLIQQWINEPVKAGDEVYVKGLGSQNKEAWCSSTKVLKLGENDGIYIREHSQAKLIEKENWRKTIGHIGADPFPKTRERIQNINYMLESILYTLNIIPREREAYKIEGIEIGECNWNPFVYNNSGEKEYYQRDFVWTEEDKRTLIDSIYNNIDCGKILIRTRGWEELKKMAQKGETELFFQEIVDGKQRLKAIKDFLENKFKDSHGNYYKDLSDHAQSRLINHQLFSYSELPESSSDESVIQQFLKLNFAGVAQSKEHILFVKEILNRSQKL